MRRRLLPALLALTLVVLLADLAGAPLGPLRGVGANTLGPLERLLAPGDDETAELKKENLRLSERVRQLEDADSVTGESADLVTDGLETTPARVVALERSGTAGPERVTIDRGRREGIRADSAVLAPGGLVGRVVEVAEWTADVEVVGSARAGVGVRTGEKGVIGTLTGTDPTTEHGPGELVVSQLVRDRAKAGDLVRTLGSPGGRPYPAGLTVGRVTDVERASGRLTDTALVEPAVDLATLDVVAVVTGKRAPS